MDYSPINFEFAQHHPTFDNVQEDMKELRSQIVQQRYFQNEKRM